MITLLILAALGSAATVEQRLDELDQRQRVLERKLELDKESAAAAAGKKEDVKLKWGVHLQGDSRFFVDDRTPDTANQFLVRRARLTVEGTAFEMLEFRLTPDFGGGTAALQDGYVDAVVSPALKFRVGKFKQPVGLESLQSDAFGHFIERGLPSALLPSRDVGAQVHGDAAGGMVKYAVGVFNGVAGGTSADSDPDGSKDGAARVLFMPLKRTEDPNWEEMGIGVGGSAGTHHAGNSALPVYRTSPQRTFFSYGTGVQARDDRLRLSPQAFWYPGSFGVLAEYAVVREGVVASGVRRRLEHRAWQTEAVWVVTGEKASYNGVKPRTSFGAVELAGRYGELLVDRGAFPLYASAAASSRTARAWTGGVNWYPTAGLKVMVDYEHARLDAGAEDEQAILSRVQLYF